MKKLIIFLIFLFCPFAYASELTTPSDPYPNKQIIDKTTGDPVGVTSDNQLKTFSTDFMTEVSKGNVPGHSAINKFGHNPLTTTGDDVWSGGGVYAFYPTTAQSLDIVSTSTDDNATDSGARTVIIYGLDANWAEQNQTVTLDGDSEVALTGTTWMRVYRAIVLTAGSGGTNAGIITVEIVGSATVAANILAGDGQTQQVIYTIPSGKTGYFIKGYVGISDDDKNGEVVEFIWQLRPNNGVTGAWATKGQVSCMNIGSSWWQYKYGIPAGPIPEKTDIRIKAALATAAVGAVAGIDILLVQDGY